MAWEGLWNLARDNMLKDRGASPKKKVTLLESTRRCMKRIS